MPISAIQSVVKKPKIFVVGLPRTGTTSVCAALLDMGFAVAHTAFTKEAVETAEVIADTPVFNDFEQLAVLFPESQFIYLMRQKSAWLPSIKVLLKKILSALESGDGVINPILLRCYQDVFGPMNRETISSDEHLLSCYYKHQVRVNEYCKQNPDRFLSIDISDEDSLATLASFLSRPVECGRVFPILNSGGKITAWKSIRHPRKIDSNASGVDRRQYYQYSLKKRKPS